jgi:hypothetical protein
MQIYIYIYISLIGHEIRELGFIYIYNLILMSQHDLNELSPLSRTYKYIVNLITIYLSFDLT